MGGDDVEMQFQREVEVVEDISLPAGAVEAQAAVGDNDASNVSPQPSPSSPATIDAQGEKSTGATPSPEAAKPEDPQQGHEANDEAEQNAAEEKEQQQDSEVVAVTSIEEQEVESVESVSPANFSFEVSPPAQDMTINTTVANADDMFYVVVKNLSSRGVVQRSTTRVSIRTETIIRNTDDNTEEEEAGEGEQDEGDDEPDQEAAPDAGVTCDAVTTKEVVVCKHCGLEFPHALREMENHKSKCEVFQQEKVLGSEAGLRGCDEEGAPKVQADGESKASDDDEAMEIGGDQSLVHDGDEAMAYCGDDATEHDHGESAGHDAEKPIDSYGDEVSDEAQDGASIRRGKDEETKSVDHDEEVQTASSKKAPLGDETQPSNAEDETLVEKDGFRVLAVSAASPSPRNAAKTLKVECLSCGRVLGYNKRTMTRHAKSCSSRLATAAEQQQHGNVDEEADTTAAAASPAMARAPVLRVMRSTPKQRAPKRKLMSIEDAIAASSPPPKQQQSSQRDDDEHELRQKAAPPPRTADFQTPRRSKRIKRDPTHSPSAAPISYNPKSKPVAQPSSPPRPSTPPPPPSTPPEPKQRKSATRRKAVTPQKETQHASFAVKSAVAMKLCGDAVNKVPDFQTPAFSNTRSDDLRGLDHRTKRVWLFGSLENADTIKSQYRESAHWIHSPCSRFEQLIHANLFDLKLVTLLEHLRPSAAVALLVDTENASLHSMGTTTVSKSEARVMYNLGLSLSFPAPEAVRELLVAPLAYDLKTSPLTEPTKHKATLMCCRSGFTYSWQFQCDDVFIFVLKGSVAWRTKKAPVLFPVRGYKPQSVPLNAQRSEEETHLKVNSKCLSRKHVSVLLPPVEDYQMGDQDDDNEDEAINGTMLEPGSVVYMPGGTWFEAEAAEDAMWIEVRIASFTPAELVRDAVYQLLVRDEQWRRPLEASQDAKTMRRHLGHLLKELGAKILSLSPSDLLPEVLLGSDEPLGSDVDQPLAAGGDIVLDIRRHAFKGGRFSKVFKTSGFRENPLAVLVAMHEIPSYATSVDNEGSGGGLMRSSSTPTSASKKKALRKKPKRKPATTMARKSTTGENEYVVLIHSASSPDFDSKLRVQFQCDPFQAALIEWVREKQGTCFHVSEVLNFAQQQQPKKPHDGEDAKYVLRFLQTVGFLSPVKMPAPEKA